MTFTSRENAGVVQNSNFYDLILLYQSDGHVGRFLRRPHQGGAKHYRQRVRLHAILNTVLSNPMK